MVGLHPLIEPLDQVVGLALEISALERGLEFRLEVILAAVDLIDDRFFIATGDRGFEIEETLVRLAEERAVVLGVAAEAADFRPDLLDDLPALARALPELLLQPRAVDVGGGVFENR